MILGPGDPEKAEKAPKEDDFDIDAMNDELYNKEW